MRIGLITTLNTNIGDDFIREGICRVLRQLSPDEPIEFVTINKHEPMMLYPRWHPLRMLRAPFWRRCKIRNVASMFSYLFTGLGFTAFDSCDAIVQCGAPVYWPECATTTAWRKRIWREVIQRLHERIPVINIAAGSCYPFERMPLEFETPADAHYARWLHRLCSATTVRDPLAQKLLKNAGCAAELIPCSAFLFTSPDQSRPDPDGPVLINYMPGAGHYDWKQNIQGERWEKTVRELIQRLETRHRVVMLCHDETELAHARRIAPQCEAILPRSYREYASLVGNAQAAVCNRLHASVALAGMGIPSVAVGTDSRLLMVSQLGLPAHYVKDVTVELLESDVAKAIANRAFIAQRLERLQTATREQYAELFLRTLPFASRARWAGVETMTGSQVPAMAGQG
jgi:polysaccharide pyruvyl transferase WcaK-like protein